MTSVIVDPFAFRSPVRSRREEILSTAAALFARHGFGAVTVDDIGAAIGISGPALYHHFASKEALLGEMLVAISDHLLAQGGAIVERFPDPERALETLIEHHSVFAVDRPDLVTVHYRNLHLAAASDQRRVRNVQGRYVTLWAETLVRRSPSLGPHVARSAVHAALGLLNSTPFSGQLDRERLIGLLRSQAAGALDVLR